jgi:hypothetical protein
MNIMPCDAQMVITLEKPSIMKREEKFIHIQQLIEQKRAMLIERQRALHKAAKQNEFLEIVKNDYAKYYDYIAKQKREQIQALETLKKYIQDLNSTTEMSKYNAVDAKMEHQKIMNEISSIKKGLDEIISNTNKIGSFIK